MSDQTPLTDFGFKKIARDEKTQKIQQLFDRVASSYDVMNDLMSFGLHRLWKQDFVNRLPTPTSSSTPFTILDLAGGTGDITERMLKKYDACSSTTNWVLADLSSHMIQQGRQRKAFQDTEVELEFVCADAQALPFPDEHFDLCTLVFGLRNMTNHEGVLREIFRILKPGGHLRCLEFSSVNSPFVSGFYDVYSFWLIPQMGRLVANDEEAYRYLVESIRRFPSQRLLASLMEEVGFLNVQFENYLGGIAALHRGEKNANL